MDLQVEVLDLHFDAYVHHFARAAVPALRPSCPRMLLHPSIAHMAPSLRCLGHFGMALGSLWAHFESLWITLGSRWVTLGSLLIVSGAIVVARPLEQGRAFSPDSYSAVAVRHVRPFDGKSVRFKAFGLCPSNVGLSVMYVNGNMGGRGFS